MAHVLQQLPAELIVYGIEGKYFYTGTDLSSEVRAVVREVAVRIAQEVKDVVRE